jgi:hypothetical protein
MSQNNLGKRFGYRIDNYGQPVNGESEQLCLNFGVCVGLLKRTVTQERAEPLGRQCFSPLQMQMLRMKQGLYQPHTDKGTVTRTGTLPPPSCGKRPTIVGESVMVLPGNQHGTAVRLTHKGSDRSALGQSHCSSRSAGKPRTWRRVAGWDAFDFTHMEASKTKGTPNTKGNHTC